jgi:hypothetical protein
MVRNLIVAPTVFVPDDRVPKDLTWSRISLADWSQIEPLEYLQPFLEVIKSPDTNGAVTDVALSSLLRILHANILGTF